jgi:hypothetical protein
MTPLPFLRQWILISPGVELYLPQCVLAFKHLHVGYRLIPVCSSTALRLFVQGHVSHDRFFICPVHFRAALIHTAHLLYCQATAISTTQTLEDRTAVRLMHFPPFPPLHKLSGVFFQEREPARTPSMLTGGKHTDRNDNKCTRWVTILL